MIHSLLLACAGGADNAPSPRDSGADTAADTDTGRPAPEPERELPEEVTSLAGEVAWSVERDGVTWCSGVTQVAGVRGDSCPTCDFSFDLSSERVAFEGDAACEIATAYSWLADGALGLRHEDFRSTDWGYDDAALPDAWYLDYVDERESTYLAPSGELVVETRLFSWYHYAGADGSRHVEWTDDGVTFGASGSRAFDTLGGYFSDWWSYCADRVPADASSPLLETVVAEGELAAGRDDVSGDVWSFPVTAGDLVRVSANHHGWAIADVELFLARPDGCLVITGGGNEPCASAPGDLCPSVTWAATHTGEARIGLRASAAAEDVADYTLSVEIDGEPVMPTQLADDTILEDEWSTIVYISSVSRLFWE